MIYRKIADSFVETELDGDLVLLNLVSGKFHALEETGLAIWQLLDGQTDEAAIQQDLMGRYNVDAATCAQKVDAFLQQLVQAGFIKAA